jgi:hypothetical protein
MKKILDLIRIRDRNADTCHFLAATALMLLGGAASSDPHPPVFGYVVMGLAVVVLDLLLSTAFVLMRQRP